MFTNRIMIDCYKFCYHYYRLREKKKGFQVNNVNQANEIFFFK